MKNDIETIKREESEMNNIISKIKKSLEEINSRLDKPEN